MRRLLWMLCGIPLILLIPFIGNQLAQSEDSSPPKVPEQASLPPAPQATVDEKPAGTEPLEKSNVLSADAQLLSRVQSWLEQLDRGQYAETYIGLSSVAKASATEVQWSAAMEVVRKPKGSVVSRKPINLGGVTIKTHTIDPDVRVVQFDSAFADGSSGVETVTLTKDPDGAWKPAGYFIR